MEFLLYEPSTISSGRVRLGGGEGGCGEKHEIYVTAFGGHLFHDLFHGPLTAAPPGSATGTIHTPQTVKDLTHLQKQTWH